MKTIRTPQDLAINGAPPAFDNPLHVGRPNIGCRKNFADYVDRMFDARWLTNDGPLVRELESKIAIHLNARHCVAMCNGTVALEIAIRALGLDGEVIVPSYTFIATAHALHWQGIKPVFADIDPETHNLDPASVRAMISPRTTGIIGVHLWGRPAPTTELQEIANRHGLALMYDAAHAFSCSHNGMMIGNFGSCEVLSFHATKFFNTFEGGAIVTNDDDLAEKARLMRNFGFAGYDNVVHPGTNGKMIEACAAMGLSNLESIDEVVSCNKQNYYEYKRRLGSISGIRVLSYNEAQRNNFQYVVVEVLPGCASTRDELVSALHAENVLARKYFWPGCHMMQPYRTLFPDAAKLLPNTEAVAGRAMVLPTGSGLPTDAIETISAVIGQMAACQ